MLADRSSFIGPQQTTLWVAMVIQALCPTKHRSTNYLVVWGHSGASYEGPTFKLTISKEWHQICSNLILRTVIILSETLNFKVKFRTLTLLSRHRAFWSHLMFPTLVPTLHKRSTLLWSMTTHIYWTFMCQTLCTESLYGFFLNYGQVEKIKAQYHTTSQW